MLMPSSCIANDYAQIRGEDLQYTGPNRAPRSALKADVNLDFIKFLFTTLSNFSKITKEIFIVWMNILRRFPGSKMVLL